DGALCVYAWRAVNEIDPRAQHRFEDLDAQRLCVALVVKRIEIYAIMDEGLPVLASPAHGLHLRSLHHIDTSEALLEPRQRGEIRHSTGVHEQRGQNADAVVIECIGFADGSSRPSCSLQWNRSFM